MRYVIFSFSFLLCFGLFAQNYGLNLVGSVTYSGEEGSDIWGYSDNNGNEYALCGNESSFMVTNVTNPNNPITEFTISHVACTWRDIKTWSHYAYITTECGNDGLLIVDLNDMTGATYVFDNTHFETAHNIYIDENGIAYIFGADVGNGGAIFLDVATDPMNPSYLGTWDDEYIHDGMVRGDTMWAACIYAGNFYAVDVLDKSNPVVFNNGNAYHATPNQFTHNCWISDDGDYLFTTDEVSGAYLGAYDVSDLNNIFPVDAVQSNPGSGTIPHNTHFINNGQGDFIVTSYYRDGTTIHDVTYPYNMIEVAAYDSYSGSGNGFDGCWGTYPWLPSGNIISNDINSGSNGNGMLLVFSPDFQQGCYLEGDVTDAVTGSAIFNVNVNLVASNNIYSNTDLFGHYYTGFAFAGLYDVVFSAPGYVSDTLSVQLINGVLQILDAQLTPMIPFVFDGQIVDIQNNGISGALVNIADDNFNFNITSDINGFFSLDTIYTGSYNIIAGFWGYQTQCLNQFIDPNTGQLTIILDYGYMDDFSLDFGWTSTGSAPTGLWERGEPIGTVLQSSLANPDEDVQGDCSDKAYITGNYGGSPGTDDVDDGDVVLTSPMFDLSNYTDPYISYYRWFVNLGGWGGGTPNDTLFVQISNGMDLENVHILTESSSNNGTWSFEEFRVSDYIIPTSDMRFIVKTADDYTGHIVEAGIDFFNVYDHSSAYVEANVGEIDIYPNPFKDYLHVSCFDNFEKLIVVTDIRGKEVFKAKMINNSIMLKNIPSGVYILKIIEGDLVRFIEKIVKI